MRLCMRPHKTMQMHAKPHLESTDTVVKGPRALVVQALQGGATPTRNAFLPAAAAEYEFQRPPLVRAASGPGPKSFPLALRASGR